MNVVKVRVNALYQSNSPFKGFVRFKLSRPNTGKWSNDDKIVLPQVWQDVKLDENGNATVDLIPNELLYTDSFYYYQIVCNDENHVPHIMQKGQIIVPNFDMNNVEVPLADLITAETSEDLKTATAQAAKAASYAAQARTYKEETVTIKASVDSSLEQINESVAGVEEDRVYVDSVKATLTTQFENIEAVANQANNAATTLSATIESVQTIKDEVDEALASAQGFTNDCQGYAIESNACMVAAHDSSDIAKDYALSASSSLDTVTAKVSELETFSGTYKTDIQTLASEASQYKTQAQSSANSASQSATEAAQSASSSLSSALAAQASADSASLSAQQASSSSTSASGFASNSAQYASEASTSAASAYSSAQAAAISEANVSTFPIIVSSIEEVEASSADGFYMVAGSSDNNGDAGLHTMSVVSAGTNVPRPLSSRFADVINVKDFGAKGDGTTDDTAAIQAAFSAGALGHIYFPKGVYCISDTLSVTGNGNGRYIDFGMAVLRWIGEDAAEDYSGRVNSGMSDAVRYSVNTYGWAYYAKPMVYVGVASSGEPTRCIIEGGVFDASSKCSIAIKVHSFGSLIHGVRVIDAKHCGIALCGSDPAVASSGGVMVSDCYVGKRSTNSNSAKRINAGLKNDVGLYVHDMDNKIDNSIFNFYGDAVVLRSSGNQFSNGHTTINIPYKSNGTYNCLVGNDNGFLSDYPDCSNVVVDPCKETCPSGTNWFSNMYFNSGRSLVKGLNGENMATVITGGGYFLKSANLHLNGKDVTEAYLYTGNVSQPLNITGMSAHHPAYIQVYDYAPNSDLPATFLDTVIDINHNSNPSGVQLIDANNLASQKSNDPVLLCDSTYPIASNKYALIGCIMSRNPTSNALRFSAAIEYMVCQNDVYCRKGVLFWNRNTNTWQTKLGEDVYGSATGTWSVFVDNDVKSIIINGKTYQYCNVYAGGTVNLNVPIMLNMRSVTNMEKIYLFRCHNYSKGAYITSIPSNITNMIQ